MFSDRDPNVWNLPGVDTGMGGAVSLVPEVQKQNTTVNLGAGASVNFDFNIDFDPIVDLMVFADQIIDVVIFLRASPAATFRQLDGVIFASGIANTLKYLVKAQRLPGSQLRLQLQNNGVTPTTVMEAQAHVRSN